MDDQVSKLISKISIKTKKIDLSDKRIGPKQAQKLIRIKLQSLQKLSLVFCSLNLESIQILSHANWPNLCQINLQMNYIGCKGMYFLESAKWQNLQVINLCLNSIQDRALKFLSRTKWKYLKTLNLDQNKFGNQGIKFLSQSNWKQLQKLNMSNNHNYKTIKDLVFGNFKHILTVCLCSCEDYKGSCSLNSMNGISVIKCNWQEAKQIDLSTNHIDHEGLKYLSIGKLKSVQMINLSENKYQRSVKDIKKIMQINHANLQILYM